MQRSESTTESAFGWLDLQSWGLTIEEIARECGASPATIKRGLARVRHAPRRVTPRVSLVPAYGCKPFTPQTTCEDIHHGPIPRGSRLYCEVESCCGIEHMIEPRNDRDPKPDKPLPGQSGLLGGVGKSHKHKKNWLPVSSRKRKRIA